MDAARAWARGGPSAQELQQAALLGLRAEEVTAQPFAVWPDNWPYVEVFVRLETQWRIGPGGAIGMDYGVIPAALRLMGVAGAMRGEYFEALQLMEHAALEEFKRGH